jgi:autotransporter-associated beta strand protein
MSVDPNGELIIGYASGGTGQLIIGGTLTANGSIGVVNPMETFTIGTSAAGGLRGAGLIALGRNSMIIYQVTDHDVYTGNFSSTSAVSINKEGIKTLTLSNTSPSFEGKLNIKDGTVVLTTTFGAGSPEINISAGKTLELNNASGNTIYENTITSVSSNATAIINKTGAGTTTLNADNSNFKGILNVTDGVLSLTNKFGAAQINISTGKTLDFAIASSANISASNITGSGAVTKNGAGTTILTNSLNSYTGGTRVAGGMLCGYIGFDGALDISTGAIYRLALNSNGSTDSADSITKTLSKPISGGGTLDLAQGCLTVTASSTFGGKIINTNTDPSKTILIVGGTNTLFDAGTVTDGAASVEHTATGTIKYATDSKQCIAGNFPNCYLRVDKSSCYVDLSNKNALFTGMISDLTHVVALMGDKALIIVNGFSDFSRAALGGQWDGSFTGQIIKRGDGRQIFFKRNNSVADDTLINTGETRIEKGTLAGVVSSSAPLYVENGALYQICCYEGNTNHTNITEQTIKGLYGKGNVDLGDFDANKGGEAAVNNGTNVIKDGSLTINVASGGEFTFDGQLRGKTVLTKTGDGTQIVTATQGKFKGGIIVADSGRLEFGKFTTEQTIELQNASTYIMLDDQGVGAIDSSSTATTFDVNSKTLTLAGMELFYSGKVIDTGSNGKIYLNGGIQTLNTQSGSVVHTLQVDNDGTLHIGEESAGTISTTQTLISGELTVGIKGTGTLTTNHIAVNGGIFNIGTTNSATTVGMVTTGTIFVNSGTSVVIGNNAGTGSFIATGTVTCNGTITVNKLVGGNAFTVNKLAGGGTFNVNNGNAVTLKGVDWTGKIADNSNTGTIFIKNQRNHNSGYKINSQTGSKIANLRLDNGLASIAYKASGELTCKTVTLENNSKLLVGDSANGKGTLKCDTINVSGMVAIGSWNSSSSGTLTCTDIITLNSGLFGVGLDPEEATGESGTGVVTSKIFNVLGGNVRIANANTTDSSGTVNLEQLNLSAGAQINIGGSSKVNGVDTMLNGQTAVLKVADQFTCNGAITTAASLLTIGGLQGAGSIAVYANSTVEINKGMNSTYNGTINNAGSVNMTGGGMQVFAGATSTYTGGTTVSSGTLCGEIGFGGALTIAAGAVYRMARNLEDIDENPDSITRTLVGPLTGNGTLNLAHSCLGLQASSKFDGTVVNTNTDPSKVILELGGNNTLFDAGALTNQSTGESIQHTAIGTITYVNDNWQRIAGNFPNCFLHSTKGHSVIDLSTKQAVFAGISDTGNTIHLSGGHALIITEGFDDFRRATFCCNWSDFGPFTGQIIKRGAKRQISSERLHVGETNYSKEAPSHIGETCVEEGTFAGVLSPNAPLNVSAGAMYQISCYDESDNRTEITKQTVKGLRGDGLIALADAGKAQDSLTINVAAGIKERFSGNVCGNGVVNKAGAGEQVIDGSLYNPEVNVNAGKLTFESVIEGPKQVNVSAGTLLVSGGLKSTDLNLTAANSVFNVATEQNVVLRINVNASEATIGTEDNSRIIGDLNVVKKLNVNTGHALRLDGVIRGNAAIEKKGAAKLTLGEIDATQFTSVIKVSDGEVDISSRANLGKHAELEVAINRKANLYANQTFRAISGRGTIDMGQHDLALNLEAPLEYDGVLVGQTGNNTVKVAGLARFKGNSLAQYHGWLDLQDGAVAEVTSATNEQLKLRLAKNAQLTIGGNRTLHALNGDGLVTGETNKIITVSSKQTQRFTGDISNARFALTGAQTFYWEGGNKSHNAGITLSEGATLIVDHQTILDAKEHINLDAQSQLHLSGTQTIRGISGSGTLYASNLNFVLTEDVTFEGDIIGQGEFTFSAETPKTFTLQGSRKSFKGKFTNNKNVRIVYQQDVFDPSVIVSGQDLQITADRTLNGTQLQENIDLNSRTVMIEDDKDITSSAWIRGPGTVKVNCAGTLTVERGIQTGAVTFNLENGRLLAASSARFDNATISLNEVNTIAEFAHSDNLASTSTVHTTKDGSIVRFNGTSAIATAARFEIDQSARIQTLCDTTLSGEMVGSGEISKEGAGKLQVGDIGARCWVVKEGMLSGTFNTESTIELLDNTTFGISGDQTLKGIQSKSNTSVLRLNGHNLTLTKASPYAGIFDENGHITVGAACDFAILGTSRDCMHIDLLGRLKISNAPQQIQVTGTGTVHSDFNVTLENTIERSFNGTWNGGGDIIKSGMGTYEIGGDFNSHTGDYYINEGTVVLTGAARLGTGNTHVSNSTLILNSNYNIKGEMTLTNAIVRTNHDVSILPQIRVDQKATFDVRDAELTLNSPIENPANITKCGNGELRLSGEYAHPIELFVDEGNVKIAGKLDSLSKLSIAGKCVVETAQEVSDLKGNGILELLSDVKLSGQTPITYDGQVTGGASLILAEGTSASFNNALWNDGFTGAITLKKDSVLHLFSDQTLRQIQGEGILDLHGHNLVIDMNADQSFYGTFVNMGSLTFRGEHSFELHTALNCAHLEIQELATVKAINPVLFDSLHADGNIEFDKTATGHALTGNGNVTLHDALSLNLGADAAFDGDIIGAEEINLTGNGSFTLGDASSFTGVFNVGNRDLTLLDTSALNDNVLVNIEENCLFKINSDQNILSITGNGAADLQSHIMKITPKSGQSFDGDITSSGTLMVDSDWCWNNALNDFSGILQVSESAHVLLENTTSFAFATLICDGTVVAPKPLTLGALGGGGTLQHADTCTVTKDSTFAGNLDGNSTFIVASGTFTWANGTKSPTGLDILSTFEAQTALDLNDHIILHEGAKLILGAAQQFTDIRGAGEIDAVNQDISLQGNISFGGLIQHADSISVIGQATIDKMSECANLNIMSSASLTLGTGTLQQITLEDAHSQLLLNSGDITSQQLSGEGTICCNGRTLSLSGELESAFSGHMENGTLCLNDHKLTLGGQEMKPLIGEIILAGQSILKVDDATLLNPNEAIQLEETAALELHGNQRIGRVQGSGSVIFDDLVVQRAITFDGHFVSSGDLAFQSDTQGDFAFQNDTQEPITLGGQSNSFTGNIHCDGVAVEMLPSCSWQNESITLKNQSQLILHANSTLAESSTMVVSGENMLILQENELTLPQSIFISNGSNLTIDVGDSTETLCGPISGTSVLTKIGTGILNIDHNNEFSGTYDTRSGRLRIVSEMSHQFGLNIEDDAAVSAEQDVLLHTLSGNGRLELATSAKLYVSEDINIGTQIYGNSFEIFGNGASQPHVTLLSGLETKSFTIGEGVTLVSAEPINSNVVANVISELICGEQTFSGLNVSGIVNTHGASQEFAALRIIGEETDSVLTGEVNAKSITYSSQTRSLSLLGKITLDELIIEQGVASMVEESAINPIKINTVKIHDNGDFYGIGRIEHLECSGRITPGRITPDGPTYGLLQVADAVIGEHAQLQSVLNGVGDEFYGRLEIEHSVEHLDNLSIILESDTPDKIKNNTFKLMSLPAGVSEDELPHIDFTTGLCRIIEVPQQSLTLSLVQNELMLTIGDF